MHCPSSAGRRAAGTRWFLFVLSVCRWGERWERCSSKTSSPHLRARQGIIYARLLLFHSLSLPPTPTPTPTPSLLSRLSLKKTRRLTEEPHAEPVQSHSSTPCAQMHKGSFESAWLRGLKGRVQPQLKSHFPIFLSQSINVVQFWLWVPLGIQ